ncbi:DNA sulfur modification protein DndD [Caulobacter sp. CCNWLY153]|uniref:DNA sulfur modification protein DndD n=1 Tax=unclassified Caulobacter TaxID=2648921 RepID=UPI002FF067B3
MIFDELTLHDFGVYGGRQTLALTPVSKDKPITLFGGLNGGGKTTLLDALQLCLYGPASRLSNREGIAYDDYLRRSIHRQPGLQEAGIELSFRHTTDGAENAFRIHRSWSAKTNVKETFEVLRNGEFDRLATDHWAEQVEEFIPAHISHLFLFDGEKVESYAALDGAPALIATAVQSLLGLDIVERLVADLGILERRKRTESKPSSEPTEEDALSAKLTALDAERLAEKSAQANHGNALDRARKQLKAVEDRFKREGGDLFEARAQLEADLRSTHGALIAARKELKDLAAGAAPLLLVAPLLKAADTRAQREERARNGTKLAKAIEEEHSAILSLSALKDAPEPLRQALARQLGERRVAQGGDNGVKPILKLDEVGALDLATVARDLPAIRGDVRSRLIAERKALIAYEQARRALDAAPSYDAIATVIADRETARQNLAVLEKEHEVRAETIARLERDFATLRDRLVRISEAEARQTFAQEDVQRVLQHSSRVRTTLSRFSQAVVAKHVHRIEELVFDSFQQLIRKRELVAALKIDPQTYALELHSSDGSVLTPDRLSAGERQLLAVALLWGLARASGRPLPMVIDTPLGRLDSQHRAHLVERYFPRASHQVILLSTDEEIYGDYYDALSASVGRTYHLAYDEVQRRTIVHEGYLQRGAK